MSPLTAPSCNVSAPTHVRSRRRLRAAVEAMETRVMLSTYTVNTFIDQTDPPASTTISLRDAIALAAAHSGPDTINVPAGTYKLAQGELLINDSSGIVTLNATGGTAVVDAGGKSRVLEVAPASTVKATGFSITGGKVTDGGGGVLNNGTLTLVNSTISGNQAVVNGGGGVGGGIENQGTLTLTGDTVSDNLIGPGGGAGIINYHTMVMTDCTIAGNSEYNNYGDAGALFNTETGTATITNSTVAGNNGCGGIGAYGSLTIANTLVAGNTDNGSGLTDNLIDVTGTVTSHGGNFVGDSGGSTGWIASDKTGTAAAPLNSKVTPLGNHGGPTQTVVPLAGSPVLAAGLVAKVPAGITTDQRGLPRVVNGKVDIGAVEVQASPLITLQPPAQQTVYGGRTQTVKLGSISDPSGTGPFVVDVHWGDGSADTIFSQPTTGAFTQGHIYPRTGAVAGNVTVTDAQGDLSNIAAFSVSVVVAPPVTVVVNTIKDQVDPAGSATVSLRDAIALAGGPVTITFDPKVFASHQTILLTGGDLEFANTFGPVTITAPAVGITIDGNQAFNILIVDSGATASLSGFTIVNGTAPGNSSPDQSSIANSGKLTISNSVIANNVDTIINTGTLTISSGIL